MHNEYISRFPKPQKGMTTEEALLYVKKNFPKENNWLIWNTDSYPIHFGFALSELASDQTKKHGKIENWKWERINNTKEPLPNMFIWDGSRNVKKSVTWTGFIKITNEKEKVSFILFSYLSSYGEVGRFFIASTTDRALLYKFAYEIHIAIKPKASGVHVVQWGGPSFTISKEEEMIVLEKGMKDDIETQIFSFFENRELYKKLKVPYKRGFLFVGSPGVGKSLMLRNLIRKAYFKYGIQSRILAMSRRIDEDDLDSVLFSDYNEATSTEVELLFSSKEDKPSIVIFEDMETLTEETQVTRSGLLDRLDGLNVKEGLLIIGTTNNPEKIDPALLQRPSRFDRVWKFRLPDKELRTKYLKKVFSDFYKSDMASIISNLVKKTNGWSFAYLNELRISSAILAIKNGREEPIEEDIMLAFDSLQKEFKAGKKPQIEESTSVGFSV